ncbi:MAG: TonB-dependent receptor plug domain-containing protein [Sulfuricurvum sp.]|uniref:TonB-dependent receptor plug domain-containing protein n=1 Tax=Sulfuricurvum sp. TaxID=2025608 RepID=UPI002612D0BC|nr:TonB-dependent receptor plug domain-containing protein [Sulfuricurvum sp.]MDD2950373.1 TonB-dependent receptor plug domain-containing protein [Sulfuricurvum sp.]MDD5118239.1 TonB-dependent receptor plug domain-containing protein [Sulfuricurvum sp.]
MNFNLSMHSALFFIVSSVCSYAQDHSENLDNLLSQYRSESDLSAQTKKESAGSFIIFTREHLEKMQAYNLRDILKTIPWFTMQETPTGQVSLAMAKASTFNSQFLKLYINDHELGSIGFGSAMKMWGFLDISDIDHIEIYQVGSSVIAGDEPPGLVIRLYTKDPSRDDGGAVQVMGGSRGSNELNAYYAHKGEKYSSFFYADTHTENRESYISNRSAIGVGRDFKTSNFFASLKGDDFTVEAAQFSLDQDRFLGIGRLHTPDDNSADLVHRYIVGTKYFQDKTLKLKISYDNSNHRQSESDPNGITLFNADGTTTTVTDWYFDKSESISEAVLDKQFTLNDHDIHVGVQSKFRKVIPNSLITDGSERVNEITGPTKWNSYSLFFSDDYTINENNLLFTNIRLDHYDRNGGANDFNEYAIRAGHIYNNGEWIWKTSAVRTYGYPAFMQTAYFPFNSKSNIDLKPEERIAAVTEVSHKTDTTNSNVRLVYNTAINGIALQNNVYINSTSKPEFYILYGSHEIHFGQDHTISLSVYYGDNNMPLTQSSKIGGYLQLFDTFGRFDVYNELLYRSSYHYLTPANISVNVQEGYDYTAGVTYHATQDLSLFIKGENLLNKAIKTPYPMPTYIDYVAPFDRTVRMGLKYVF